MIRWLLPVQLAVFGASICSFALSTLFGAACGLGRAPEIASIVTAIDTGAQTQVRKLAAKRTEAAAAPNA
jgi:hypothetical protein